MMLFRKVQKADLDAIYKLALHTGNGLTTLPKDKAILEARLNWALESFAKQTNKPEHELYLFILEDTKTKKVVGISGIESSVGKELPFYSYKLSKRTRISHSLNIRSDYEVLSLVNDNQGASEICSLFLEPEYRKNANGLLLSKARFLFMAQFKERFQEKVIAEMRGVSDEKGHSPFWDNVGQHFFHMAFPEADRLTISTNKQFIADLMPRNPIYVKLLSEKAQAVIGQPHESTAPAMNILIKEGFRYQKYIDIFDAGPTLETPINEIRSIERSLLLKIKNLSDEVSSKRVLIANTDLDFRASLSRIIYQKEQCVIDKKTADLLKVKVGDYLRITNLEFNHEAK